MGFTLLCKGEMTFSFLNPPAMLVRKLFQFENVHVGAEKGRLWLQNLNKSQTVAEA